MCSKMIMITKNPGSQVRSPGQQKKEERRGLGGGRGGEKKSAMQVDAGIDGAKSEIKVESKCGHEWSAKDFSESIREITVCNDDIGA